jgi:hypothetical protein
MLTMTTKHFAVVLGLLLTSTVALAKEEYQLPPEVTPAIRTACETDVRRLCIGENPTADKVKSCVLEKFFKLNKQCQVRLMAAGFSP